MLHKKKTKQEGLVWMSMLLLFGEIQLFFFLPGHEKKGLAPTHLQDKAEICRCLVFALEVFAVVDVEVVKLDKADEVAGRLERSRDWSQRPGA